MLPTNNPLQGVNSSSSSSGGINPLQLHIGGGGVSGGGTLSFPKSVGPGASSLVTTAPAAGVAVALAAAARAPEAKAKDKLKGGPGQAFARSLMSTSTNAPQTVNRLPASKQQVPASSPLNRSAAKTQPGTGWD